MRERERERERVSREGARDEVTRPCTIPTIRLIIIPNRFANTATRAAEFHRFLRISLLLSFLFRLLPLTRSPSFVILSTRRKCEYISCILSFFFFFFFLGAQSLNFLFLDAMLYYTEYRVYNILIVLYYTKKGRSLYYLLHYTILNRGVVIV